MAQHLPLTNLKVRYMRYQSPLWWFHLFLIGFCLIVGGLLIANIGMIVTAQGKAPAPVEVVVGLIMFGIGLYAAYHLAGSMETYDQGLRVIYWFRPSRVIPWSQIHKITIRFSRGLYLRILGPDSEMWASMQIFWFSPNSKIEELMRIIADAAHLTRCTRNFRGRPTYERETTANTY